MKKLELKSGIYRIINKVNNKCYIGSAINIFGRFATHRNQLRDNKHHSVYLQRSWNKYGEDNFVFERVEYCEKNILLIREQYYIDLLTPEYNMCKIAGSSLGMKGTLESNQKKSDNHFQKGKFGKDNLSSIIVYQYDLNGIFLKEWENAECIKRELELDPANIRTSIKEKVIRYGFFWSYEFLGNIYTNIPKVKDRSKTCKKINQYSLDGVFIATFNSIKDAKLAVGGGGGINACLKGESKTSRGYI
jgi:group I intron endonuclease